MGLLNKLKDLFIDEEDTYETKEIEVEEKEEKNELPTFMRNKIEKDFFLVQKRGLCRSAYRSRKDDNSFIDY